MAVAAEPVTTAASTPERGDGTGITSLLSSDSEAGAANLAGGASSEFDRLMEDSVDSDAGGGGGCGAAPPIDTIGDAANAPMLHASPQQLFQDESSSLSSPSAEAKVTVAFATDLPLAPVPPASFTQLRGKDSSMRGSDVSTDCEDSWALTELSGRLEDISRDMRRSVEHEFVLAQRQLTGRHRAELEAQQLKSETRACQQHAAIEALQAEVQQLTRRLDVRQRQWKSSQTFVQHARRRCIGRSSLCAAVQAWRSHVASEKDARSKEHLAGRLRLARLANVLFGAWRRQAQLAYKETLVAHERAVADQVRSKLFEQMELERERTTAEVERLSSLLAEEQRQRALLQENLKRVFMRGVCALNFEAMTLLSDGTTTEQPPAGAFDWSQFAVSAEASGEHVLEGRADASATQACSLATDIRPIVDVAVAATSVPSAAAATKPTALLLAPASAVPSSHADAPRQTPVPLPFVTYAGPQTQAPSAVQHQPRSQTPKGLRWQAAAPPRSATGLGVQPRPEVVSAGG